MVIWWYSCANVESLGCGDEEKSDAITTDEEGADVDAATDS